MTDTITRLRALRRGFGTYWELGPDAANVWPLLLDVVEAARAVDKRGPYDTGTYHWLHRTLAALDSQETE